MPFISFNIPKYSFSLPWFIYDIDNMQLITNGINPSDIRDTKDIVLAEIQIPGQNFQPITYGGGGNRKISFTIKLIKRNNTVGNVLLLKQYENLRNQSVGLLGIFSGKFQPNPKVVFYWGVGSMPLVYWVKKCDFVHKENWINQMGNPQLTEIEFELWLDETNPLYKAEEVYRKFSSISGMAIGTYNVLASEKGDKVF